MLPINPSFSSSPPLYFPSPLSHLSNTSPFTHSPSIHQSELYQPYSRIQHFPRSPSPSSSSERQEDCARKIFVGGLSWQTTEDGLKHFFESKGLGVESVVIMRDRATNRSRGFGFVTFTRKEFVERAVSFELVLDGRRIEAKLAIPKKEMENSVKKIFVGGIPLNLNENDLKRYFEGYGKVLEAQVMTEKHTGESRGFGFVTFSDENVARSVLKSTHVINGKLVEVKKAEPKRTDRRPILIPFPFPYFPQYHYPAPIFGGSPQFYGAPLIYDPQGYFVAPYPSHYGIPVDVDPYGQSQYQRIVNSPVSKKLSKGSTESPKARRSTHQIINSIPLLRVSGKQRMPSPHTDRQWGTSITNSNSSVATRSRRGLSQPVSVEKNSNAPIGTPAPFKRAPKTKSYDFTAGIHKYFQ